MENFNQPLDAQMHLSGGDAPEGLEVTPVVRETWWEIGNWTRYLSILMYVFLSISILFSLLILYIMSKASVFLRITETMKLGVFFGIFLSCLFFSYQGIYLNQFSTGMKNCLRYDMTDWLEYAAEKLHAYYRFLGVILAILTCFFILTLLYLNLMPPRSAYEVY